MPRLIGLSLYRLDINFRESAVIGIVGAGGIGATLNTSINRYDYDTSAAVLLIILLLARALRRFGISAAPRGDGTRRLVVEEVLPIDGRRRVLLLRCEGRRLLLVTGGPQDVLLPLEGEKG